MRTIVTGVIGQDGIYLAELMLSKGNTVYGTYRRTSSVNFWRIEELGIDKHPNLHLVELGLSGMDSAIGLLLITESMSDTGKTLAKLVGERMVAYPISDKINCRLDDVQGAIERVLAHFTLQNPGLGRANAVNISFDKRYFNLSAPNTESFLLNVATRANVSIAQTCVQALERLINASRLFNRQFLRLSFE